MEPVEVLVARMFHETYERLAPEYGWDTQPQARVPWAELPKENRELMVAVVRELLDEGTIAVGDG